MSFPFFKIKTIDYETLESKKVSLILITFRQTPKLELLFESLSHQTVKNFELVIGDYLYDSRKDYIKELSEKFGITTIHMDRNKNPDAAYAVYDTDEGMVWIKRVEYNVQKTADKILKAKLPDILAERIKYGR